MTKKWWFAPAVAAAVGAVTAVVFVSALVTFLG
jgi:hypothetical protein